jgi:2-keto-4-pentenoate hydratase/2-oxohepta-3-ene-1,7-dioic acid hydratase in catechol pathway
MRLVRFRAQDETRYGAVEEEYIRVLRHPPYEGLEWTGERIPTCRVQLLAPCEPSKIVGIGLNYRDHAAEFGLPPPNEPMLFLKPATAVIGPGQEIRYPEASRQVDYEAELGVVIGRTAHRIRREEASSYILGYTCLNDVTARDLQAKDVQFTRSKSFDTFAPLGPWIATDSDPLSRTIESYLNGQRKQHSNTRELVFDPFHLVYFISWIMTLNPGDVIASGTPGGVGPMHPGDEIEIRIEGIGSLMNRVVSRDD